MFLRRLELGSGYHPLPGFEHLDANPNCPELDYVWEALDALPFEDNTFEEIRAVDVLEHASYRDSLNILREWARILMPGGRLYVQVPDTLAIMTQFVNGTPPVIDEFSDYPAIVTTAWKLLGGHADGDRVRGEEDWRWNAHYSLWTEPSIRWYADQVGLIVVSCITNPHPNLLVWLRKP